MSFIFATSTYALGYKLPEDLANEYNSKLKAMGIRFLNLQDLKQLKEDLVKVKYLLGFFFSYSPELDAELTFFKEHNSYFHIYNHQTDDDAITCSQDFVVENVGNNIQAALDSLLPQGLVDLCQSGANYIHDSIFPGLTLEFQESKLEHLESYDLLVQCDTASSPFSGRCIIEINSERLVENYAEFGKASKELRADSAMELINQYLGVINHNLIKQGASPKIGLPNVFDFEEAAGLKKTGLYIPYASVADTKGVFLIRTGFVNGETSEKLDLSSIEFEGPDDEIDFL
jgi:hypothetical protein